MKIIKYSLLLIIFSQIQTFLIGQETLISDVFYIDPQLDLSKATGKIAIQSVRVFPSAKTPSGFEIPEYTFNKNTNNIDNKSISKTKNKALEIDPDHLPKFIYFNPKVHKRQELLFDINAPGVFMDREGNIIKPSSDKLNLRGSQFRAQDLEPVKAKTAVADNFSNAKKALRISFPTDNPKIEVIAALVRDNSGKSSSVEFTAVTLDYHRCRLMTLQNKDALLLQEEVVKLMSTALAQKLMEISITCGTRTGPLFCEERNIEDPTGYKKASKELLPLIRSISGFENSNLIYKDRSGFTFIDGKIEPVYTGLNRIKN